MEGTNSHELCQGITSSHLRHHDMARTLHEHEVLGSNTGSHEKGRAKKIRKEKTVDISRCRVVTHVKDM